MKTLYSTIFFNGLPDPLVAPLRSIRPFAAMAVVAARPEFAGCQVFAPRLSTITPALDSCSRSHIAKHQLLHAIRQLQARSQSPRLLIGSLAGLVPAATGPEPTARA